MKNNKLRFVALVGLGYWGKNLLRCFYRSAVLHTACDNNPVVLKETKEKYPAIRFESSFDRVIKHSEIKAIAIATPAATHFRLTKKALLAGKDVFVEKPMALKVEEGKELVEVAKREKRILMVGHILRYHPAIIRLRKLILSGKLGRLQYIYSNRLNIGRLRTEENILWSFAPHDISAILMLISDELVKVSAFAGDYLNRGINDVSLTMMEFRSGVKGHIFVSWLHPYKEQKLIVVGSKAMAVFDDLSAEKLYIYPHKIEWRDGKVSIVKKADFKIIPVDNTEPLNLELEHFIKCIQKRISPETDGNEGLKVLRVLEAAEKSLSSGIPARL
jgi:UDP-2-acetamido-3-amino-2,3-dideoxy-glucuronate N-acetyltransferase